MVTISRVVTGTYDPYLVALSILVACFASYTGLDLGGCVALTQGPMQGIWLTVAALTMGGGIWSMHFVAMLAFVLPMPMSYDIGLTVLSLRSAEHPSELPSLMRISYAVFCLKTKNRQTNNTLHPIQQ